MREAERVGLCDRRRGGEGSGRDGSRVTPRLLVGTCRIWGTPEECSIHVHMYYTHNRHMCHMCILGRERGWKEMPRNDNSHSPSVSRQMGYFISLHVFKISYNKCTSFHNQSKVSSTSKLLINIRTVLSSSVSPRCVDRQVLSIGTLIRMKCVTSRVSLSGRK